MQPLIGARWAAYPEAGRGDEIDVRFLANKA
jgi:hypothetical protein